MGGANSKQEDLNDKNYKGENYTTNPRIRDGPINERNCTDMLFNFIFLIFIAWYGYTVYYAYEYGKP